MENGLMGLPPRVSEWRRFRRVFLSRGVVVFGMIVLFLFIMVAILAPWIAPYGPYEPDLRHTLENPSGAHWLGTDALGRDTLSRIIFGTRTSLEIGLIVVSVACIVGITLGTLAGYYGGWVYVVIMRFVDALMSFPMILLALVVAALLGGGMRNLIIALGVALMPGYARLMCGQVLSVKQNDYIMAGRAMGASNLRLMLRHIALNCVSPIIVQITMMLGATILAEAGLSFLGIGITPPTAAWGSMVSEAREYLLVLPILSFAPGLALMLAVFAFNMVGDGLRDALDPRLRGLL
ncbi:MAG: ABC transporter permease [Chloroflexi bacterium RBG_16_56_11]|nr:MAG: ABC transporter permease [Chloroflexi bacterium RBG_16_56_11]